MSEPVNPAPANATPPAAPPATPLPDLIVGPHDVTPLPGTLKAVQGHPPPAPVSPVIPAPVNPPAPKAVDSPAPKPVSPPTAPAPEAVKAARAVPAPMNLPALPPVDSPFAPAPEELFGTGSAPLHGMPSASGSRLVQVLQAPPKAAPEPLLKAEGLTKRFGKREVVSGVNLAVGPGEIVGLLGRNGAGKTTTFRMILGMLHPDHGRVNFEARDITRLPMYQRANRGLGYLAQEPSVFQRLSVEDNLMAVLELQVPERARRQKRLEELVHDLGLETVRKSIAATLSGGERRRLEIARAMILKPRVVLFDEPFAGIDPIAVTEIQDILRDLRAAGVGVLLTDHNVRETLTITDRTYIMDEGKIWIHGSPREIVNHPEARQRYLGQGFRLDF